MCTASKTMYDVKDSSYSKYMKKDGKDIKDNLKYGSGTIKGVLFEDRVCLDADAEKCLKNFELIEITESTGLNNVHTSGLVGLSPGEKVDGIN